MQLYPVVKIEM